MPGSTIRVTGSSRESMMAQRRMQENSQRNLVDFVDRSSKLQALAKQETSIPQRRKQLKKLEEEQEQRLRKADEERLRGAQRRDLEATTAEAFAGVLETRQAEKLRKEREILRICSESEELKDLETKLNIAYVNKERAKQHEEKLQREARERLRDHAIEAAMEQERREKELAEMSKSSTSKDAQARQQQYLQDQIRERERRSYFAEEEAKRDKSLVDAVVEKIQNEDRAEYEVKAARKRQSRDLIAQYEVQRQRELEEKYRKDAEEDRAIQKHAQHLAHREAEARRQVAEKQARDAENFRRIVQETEKAREQDEEMQNLRDILWEEETQAARRAEDHARERRRLQLKQDMARANEQQVQAKADKLAQERQAELDLIQLMQEKFAKDDLHDKQQAQARRDAKQAYIDAVAKQKSDRNALYEQAKQAELDAMSGDQQADEYKQRVINEARRRLLEQHAATLDGFLPKDVLKPHEAAFFPSSSSSGPAEEFS